MSVDLLDINVLVALFDPAHIHHESAHAWLGANRKRGWATCPLTENGVVRVLSQPGYRRDPPTPAQVVDRLTTFRASGDHAFWPDELSLCDANHFESMLPATSRQLTDVYLLALAIQRGGRLVTFDRTIPIAAVVGAERRHLVILGA